MKKLLTFAAVLLALTASGDGDRKVTDGDVAWGGEELNEQAVAMSCRLGGWRDEWESKGVFQRDDYEMLLTKDEGVEVLVPKARKGLLDALRQQPKGTEMTLLGKVHWAKGIKAYLVIHDWKKGLSQPYEPKKVQPVITVTFGGKQYDMERGKSYTVTTPKGEKVEASWAEKDEK